MEFEVESLESNKEKSKLKRKNKNPNKQQTKKFKHNESNEHGKLSKAELYKPPTVEELNQLRETEILFNSNLFRLQTEELLKEIAVNEKRIKAINEWIENFKELIDNIPEIEFNVADVGCVIGHSINEKLTKKLKNIIKHYPSDIKTDVYSHFKLLKPKNVKITGLYEIKTICKPIAKINLNIIIPKNCFLEKDYLNFRYIVKRSLYLAYITSYLKNSNLVSELNYNHLFGNKLIPILEIKPVDIKNTIFYLRITAEENSFKLSRFEPEKINIKSTYINSIDNNLSFDEDFSTPFYNSVMLNDLTLNQNDEFKSSVVKGLKGACDGLVLLNIWLEQRKLCNGYGGFNEDILYSLIAYLVKNGKINKHMSSYQVIRNVWTHLSTSNWEKTGISLNDSPYDLENFHKYYDVVFVDQSGKYNLAADLDLNIYLKIKHEATLAISYLDDGKFNSFQALFITKMPFYLQFDAIINVECDEKLCKIFKNCEKKYQVDYAYFKYPTILKELINKLKIGLSDRINFLIPLINTHTSWNVDKSIELDNKSVTIGVNLNYFNLHKVVEKGPPTYDPTAQNFRDFWGDKAELRRFKDGTITEAVYWQADNLQEKRTIFKNIINFILETKLQLKKFSVISDQFDSVLKLYPYSGVEEANVKVVHLFDELGKLLRGMKLPLDITAIQGISEAFSYSDAFPPTPLNYIGGKKITFTTENNILLNENQLLGMVPKYVCPVEGIIQMAYHSKWPNDYEALCKLKTAFYIEISKLLKKEENIRSNPKPDFLEILFNGLVFCLTIFHPKQLIELKKKVDELGVMSFEDNEESILQEQKYIILPKLIGSLNGLHSQYPSYGPSTVLIKRWFNSQLIDDNHFPKIIINLLNASLYMNSAPFTQPALPQLAFFRFLHLLATSDWNLQPVILNFNNEIPKEQLDEHESQFHRNRAQFYPLHIITPYDNFKSVLTKYNPTTVILNRLKILGKEAVDIIENNLNSRNLFSTMAFFKPNLIGYNILIHLKPLLNPTRHQSVYALEEKRVINKIEYKKDNDDKIPVVDFNPVHLYLKELRNSYDDYALFFHDSYGGNVIAVLWKPTVYEEQEFKIGNVAGKMLTEDKKLKVNIDAIIEDFYILGDGLVRTIEKK